jgi:predicted DNA-binding transcriptional regulator AlpA
MPTSKERSRFLLPRLLRRPRAANYLDVSEPTFDALVRAGIVSQPKRLGAFVRGWDRLDLDRDVDALPYDVPGAAQKDADDEIVGRLG